MNAAVHPIANLRNTVDDNALKRVLRVLLPLIAAVIVSGDVSWMHASLVTISVFIAVDRSGLAPLGAAAHALTIAACFLALAAAYSMPVLFVVLIAALAMASILITAKGAELRQLGSFTFIPALYLACELGERAAPGARMQEAVAFLPVLALATAPVIISAVVDHHRSRSATVP